MSNNENIAHYPMERDIKEEEIQEIKKDALQKLMHSVIAIVAFVIIAIILYKFAPGIFKEAFEEVHLPRGTKRFAKYLAIPLVAGVVAVIGLLIYGVGTFKKAIKILVKVKNAKVIDVYVPAIKDKSRAKSGYRFYADICMYVNGQPQAIEVPILTNSIKYIRWQKKGKLYFVHSSFYMLGKIDR